MIGIIVSILSIVEKKAKSSLIIFHSFIFFGLILSFPSTPFGP